MAKKSPGVRMPKDRQAAHKNVPAHTLQEVFEVSDDALLQQKVNEIARLLWVHDDASEEKIHERVVRALELYESLEPADGAEGMLATQMVGTHEASLECLRMAAHRNQTFAVRDMALKHAHKLMSLYTQQLAALNKHRGKGQQKVTVEHVNVAPGGQAIVGHVETGAGSKPKALEQADTIEPDIAQQPRVKSKKRKTS